jgi:hypothetical protein
VPQRSACIDAFGVRTCAIPANHMDMSKYTDESDVGYMRTSGSIIDLVSQAIEQRAISESHISGPAAGSPFLGKFHQPPVSSASVLPNPERSGQLTDVPAQGYEVEEAQEL